MGICTTPGGNVVDRIEFSIIFTRDEKNPQFLKPVGSPEFDTCYLKENVDYKGFYQFDKASCQIKSISVFEKRESKYIGDSYAYIEVGLRKPFIESRMLFADGYQRIFNEKCYIDLNKTQAFAISSDKFFHESTHVVLSGLLDIDLM